MEVYPTVLEQTVHAINTTPYLTQGNYGLLTPAHFINPWIKRKVIVRELPESNILELRRMRNILVNQMVVINEQMKEELCMEVER